MGGVADAVPPRPTYRLPMFPLSTVLFPLGRLPLHVFEPRYRQLTADCLSANGELGVVLITRGREVGGGDERAAVGTVGHIDRAVRLSDGRWLLSVGGRRRVRVREWLPERPYPVAMVEDLDGPDGGTRRATEDTEPTAGTEGAEEPMPPRVAGALATVRRARALSSEAGRDAPLPAEVEARILTGATTVEASWLLCDAAPLGDLDRQRLLETGDVLERLDLARTLAGEVADDLERLLGS